MKKPHVQQKTERRISAALRLGLVAVLLLAQIALVLFLSDLLRQRMAMAYTVLELLVPIFLNGRRVYDSPSLPEIQAYCRQQVDTLWDEVKRFDYPHKYVVDLSRKLWDIQQELLRSSQQ